MNRHLHLLPIAALALAFVVSTDAFTQQKGRTATVEGVLKARLEIKNSKHLVIEVLADGEESPRKYGVPHLPKEKGPVGDVHPAVLKAGIGDRVRCELVYGAYGYESGFAVVAFQVIKKGAGKSAARTVALSGELIVSDVRAVHRHGQTFVTCKDVVEGDEGVKYRCSLYRSEKPNHAQ